MLTIDEFWACFDRSGGPDTCWPWMRGCNGEGYGVLRVGPAVVKTHTIAWETHHRRRVPAGKVLRHTCDNQPCGNPAHLILGTQGDNLRDQYFRDRRKRRLRHA